MLAGESPLAFFLRTKATGETAEVAKETQEAEASAKDAFWKSDVGGNGTTRVDFLYDGVHIAPVEGKGRGLLTKDAIPVGAVVLRERAVAAVPLDDRDVENPILSAVMLATSILIAGREATTRTLAPRLGAEFAEHPVRRARAADLAKGRVALQTKCPKATEMMDEDALERLLLVNTLNTHGLRLPGGGVHQGLFAEFGAMVNHSCKPNLIFHGRGIAGAEGSHDQLQLVLQAVRNIEEGEELTISYLGDLYLPFAERDERLQDVYGFPASHLPTDPSLEAFSASAIAKGPCVERELAVKRVMAANERAHTAWEHAGKMRAADPERAPAIRKFRQIAATQYAALLNENLLAETHSWRYNATWRLASLLMADDPPKKACEQALVLWQSAMRSGRLIWPSEHWTDHRNLLRGAQQAALGAGETAKSEDYARHLAEIEQQMSTAA